MKNFCSKFAFLVFCAFLCVFFVSCTKNEVSDFAEEEVINESSYMPGERTEHTYDSEWAGIHYEIPEGFTMLSDEETWEMMGIGAEASLGNDSEKVLEYLKNSDNVIEFMAKNSIGCSVTATVEKTPLNSKQYADELSFDFENAKMDNIIFTVGEPVDFKINDVEFVRLDVESYYISQDYTAYLTYLIKGVDGERQFSMIFSSILPINDAYIEGVSAYNG